MFADLALARRLEAEEAAQHRDYVEARRRMLPEIPYAELAVAGGHAFFAGTTSPFSRALGAGLHGPVTEADLSRFEDLYRDRDTSPRISLCPLADPSLVELLAQRGYRIEQFMNAWVRELTRDESFPAAPAGITVRPIAEGEENLWRRVNLGGGLEDEEVLPDPTYIIAPYPLMANTTCWLAWLDGQPAGAATLGIHDGVARLFGTSTRPSRRNRGVQTALIRARLAAAAATGCDLATTLTTPGSASQRNVERAGFRLAYTKVILGSA